MAKTVWTKNFGHLVFQVSKPSSYWGIPMTMETPYISKKILASASFRGASSVTFLDESLCGFSFCKADFPGSMAGNQRKKLLDVRSWSGLLKTQAKSMTLIFEDPAGMLP